MLRTIIFINGQKKLKTEDQGKSELCNRMLK